MAGLRFFQLLVLYAGLSLGPESWAAVGRTLSVTGRPSIQAKDSEMKALTPGTALNAYETVTTDNLSTAKLHLNDETILDVGLDSTFLIPNIIAPDSPERKILIEIMRGKIRANVNREVDRTRGQFEVHTNAAIMGVEGTDFVIDVSPITPEGTTTTTVTVFEGQVAVRSGKEKNNPGARHITLTKGMTFTATAKVIGEIIEQDEFDEKLIQKLDDASLNDIAGKAHLTNKTFLQAVSLTGNAAGFGGSTLKVIGQNLKVDPVKSVKKKGGDGLLTKKLFTTRFNDSPENGNSPSAKVNITAQ